jgi:lipopolysaccharide/colanic/teichoic acid biosynthesis glycosyltransferase
MSEHRVGRANRSADPRSVQRSLKTADFLILFIATLAVFLGSSLLIPAQAVSLIGFFALEVALGSMLMMAWVGLYRLDMLLRPLRGVVAALAVTAALGTISFVSTHLGLFPIMPWWLAGWAIACLVHFAATRTAAYLWVRPRAAAGAFRQRVAVVGWGDDAQEAIRLIEAADPLRLEVVGVFDERSERADAGSRPLAELVGAAKAGSIDLVIVAIPLPIEDRLLQTLRQLWPLPVDVRIARRASELKLSPRAYGYLGRLPLLSVFDRQLGAPKQAKHLIDRTLASVGLVLLLPVLALAALALRIEGGGPMLLRDERLGFDGATIRLYRFRCDGAPLVGGVLRALGLDGLPQLLNVLNGDLSLVGPRLHPAETPASLYRQVIDGYFARHGVKPGLTGWAQINGWPDGEPVSESTTKHDLEYVDRWSVLFDLCILFKAPFALLRRAAAE